MSILRDKELILANRESDIFFNVGGIFVSHSSRRGSGCSA
jgi:hypothetical protein